jgi:hypothetical protein
MSQEGVTWEKSFLAKRDVQVTTTFAVLCYLLSPGILFLLSFSPLVN